MQDYPPYPPFTPPPVMPPVMPPIMPPVMPPYLPWFCLISGLGGWFIPFFGGLAAVYSGYAAQRQMREYAAYYGTPYPGYGMVTAGLVLGFVQLAFFLVACCVGVFLFSSGGWGAGWPYCWW